MLFKYTISTNKTCNDYFLKERSARFGTQR